MLAPELIALPAAVVDKNSVAFFVPVLYKFDPTSDLPRPVPLKPVHIFDILDGFATKPASFFKTFTISSALLPAPLSIVKISFSVLPDFASSFTRSTI